MITFSIENNDNYSEEEFHKIGELATNFFYAEPDDEQLPPEEYNYEFSKNKTPFSTNIIKEENKVIGFTSIIPCDERTMKLFLNKKINEKEMWHKIKNLKWKEVTCAYLAATLIIPTYQKKGIGTKARITHINKIQELYPNLKKLFCWTYTKEGKKLIKKVIKEINQEILIRD